MNEYKTATVELFGDRDKVDQALRQMRTAFPGIHFIVQAEKYPASLEVHCRNWGKPIAARKDFITPEGVGYCFYCGQAGDSCGIHPSKGLQQTYPELDYKPRFQRAYEGAGRLLGIFLEDGRRVAPSFAEHIIGEGKKGSEILRSVAVGPQEGIGVFRHDTTTTIVAPDARITIALPDPKKWSRDLLCHVFAPLTTDLFLMKRILCFEGETGYIGPLSKILALWKAFPEFFEE